MNITITSLATIAFAAMLVVAGGGVVGAGRLIPTANAQNVFPGLGSEEEQQPSGGSSTTTPVASAQFSAENIYKTQTMQVDADIKNLVIFIPDQKLIDQGFLPKDVTIVKGTKVVWVNGQINTVHSVAVRDDKGKEIFTSPPIPYKNGTEFTFDDKGTYSYSDSQSPSAQGSINVIDKKDSQDDISTNSTTMTAGVFVVPAARQAYFDKHFTTLGYHLVSDYIFEKPGTSSSSSSSNKGKSDLIVYTQDAGKFESIVKRTGVKISFLEPIIYPELKKPKPSV
jgi:plastocyanin